MFGIGGGWNAEEMENHGTNFATRWALLRERVAAMKQIWTEDAAEYHGRFVNFDPIWSWPKPLQPGGPKVLLGADSKFAAGRVADYCDGWFPIALKGEAVLRQGMADLRRACDEKGRDFASIDLTVFGVLPKEEFAAKMVELGFHRLVFALPPAPSTVVLPILDRCAEFARKLS